MKISLIIILLGIFNFLLSGAEYIILDLNNGKIKELDSAPEDLLTSKDYKTDKMVLRRIKAGTFMMGSPKNENGRTPDEMEQIEVQHKVTLSKDYYIGVFEVTQGQYELLMKKNPSHFTELGATAPVERVSWYSARGGTWPDGKPDNKSFMGKLRRLTGKDFDLPTEAQWEYACRAGTTTATYAGNIGAYDFEKLDEIAWFYKKDDDSSYSTHPVGLKKPNAWGLYDMLGNVWEWCLERRSKFTSKDVVDPTGAEYELADEGNNVKDSRVTRGGAWSWLCGAAGCRSSERGIFFAKIDENSKERSWGNDIGFRVVLNTGD